MGKSRKHHFVPWSYLRYFSIDPKSDRKSSIIYVYDRITSSSFIDKTEDVKCYEKGQNTVPELPDPEHYEILYTEADNQLSKAGRSLLQRLRNDPENATIDKSHLSYLMILLFKRQPFIFRDVSSKITNNIEDVKNSIREEYQNILPYSLVEQVINSKTVAQYAHEISLNVIGNGFEALKNKVWFVFINKTDIPFITSDNPLCPQLLPNFVYNKKGISDSACAFFFPLSPDVIIYMIDSVHTHRDKTNRFDYTIENLDDKDFVIFANNHQLTYCTRQIYSNQEITPEMYSIPSKKEYGK